MNFEEFLKKYEPILERLAHDFKLWDSFKRKFCYILTLALAGTVGRWIIDNIDRLIHK